MNYTMLLLLLLLLLLLFSHELIATMQSVVTGQAPTMTLERKITSGGKTTKKKQKVRHKK